VKQNLKFEKQRNLPRQSGDLIVSKKTSALIPVNIIDGVEAYIVLDKPGYKPGSEAKIHILLYNHGDTKEVTIQVREEDNVLFNRNTKLESNKSKILTLTHSLPEKSGFYHLELLVNNTVIDKINYIVNEPALRDPFYFTIVWHHHQAPNYYPDGRIHSPWAYIYVWGDHLKPYGKGPYHYHTVMLKNHPNFKSTYNLSPSLLYQWMKLLEEGIEFVSGEKYSRDSIEARLVEETLNSYREALRNKQIDVLTSIYAHTIAGFLTDLLGMDDIVYEEIKYGLEITMKAMGNNYRPLGIWTPEMAFSMKLVPIIYDIGLKYTILDDLHHFRGAEGEKDSQYKPYMVIDTSSGKHLIVFFRDHVLSDILGFKNNFNNELHAWRNAYELSYQILRKWFDETVKVLVLALDGENWMVFSHDPPLTAFFYDKFIIYLETLNDLGYLKLSTLREMYERIPVNNVLKHIPTNSWLGTFRKWRGEVSEHEKYWNRVYESYKLLRAYEEIVRGDVETSKRIRWYLWHVLDSDYWWAEFWYPEVINTWLNEIEKTLDDKFSKIRISDIKPVTELVEGLDSKVLIEIENDLEHKAYLNIKIVSPGFESNNNIDRSAVVEPSSNYSVEVVIKPKYSGKQYVEASIVSNNHVIKNIIKEIYVKPYIPDNPV